MSVGLLLVTHGKIGVELIAVVEGICGQAQPRLYLISIPSDLQPDDLGRYADMVRDAMLECDGGDGVLVMTDLFGATPDNLARHFSQESNAPVVSGINLPMLLRVLNYPQESLEELTRTAQIGERERVLQDRQ